MYREIFKTYITSLHSSYRMCCWKQLQAYYRRGGQLQGAMCKRHVHMPRVVLHLW